jgi:DNA polymerase-3 subunit delta'
LLTQNDGHVSLEAWGKILEAENKQFTIYTEQTLDIIKEVGMKSFESEYKIIIIWLVEKLYRGAVSKILKSLEEPNDKTLFILVTENYEDVITTIISRTQLIKVNKYSDNEIRNALIDKYHADTLRASEIARISDGNFNYALNLFKQGVDNSELNLFIKFTRSAFSFSRTGKGYKEMNSCVDEISKLGREKIKDFLRFSLLMYQQSLYLNKTATNLTRITNEESAFLEKFFQFITPTNIGIIYSETNTAIYHIESNGYAMLVLTDYALKIGKALNLK